MDKLSELRADLAPVRNLHDFIADTARFQLPNFGDLEKWGNRVVNNLLYYQTNYFLIALIILLSMTLAYPLSMFVGFSVTALGYISYNHMSHIEGTVKTFKDTHPLAAFGSVAAVSIFVLYLLGFLVIFSLSLLLPFCITFVHASLRKRNIKNKLTNKVEEMGIKKSPMGLFLSAMSLEPEIFK